MTDADPAQLAELAHHWVAATRPTDLSKALQYVRRAGDAALAALAPLDAIRWYEEALDLVEREPNPDRLTQAKLLGALGTAQRLAAQPEYQATLVEAGTLARELNDSCALVLAALGFRQVGLHMVGDDLLKPIVQAALDSLSVHGHLLVLDCWPSSHLRTMLEPSGASAETTLCNPSRSPAGSDDANFGEGH